LRLPWKTEFALRSRYWIFIFYYSEFWTNCACPENRFCPDFSGQGGGRPLRKPLTTPCNHARSVTSTALLFELPFALMKAYC